MATSMRAVRRGATASGSVAQAGDRLRAKATPAWATQMVTEAGSSFVDRRVVYNDCVCCSNSVLRENKGVPVLRPLTPHCTHILWRVDKVGGGVQCRHGLRQAFEEDGRAVKRQS
jgi:hypothetical protein